MRGRDGTDTSYATDTITIGAGESFDAIFTAPPYTRGSGPYDTYMLYNRAYPRSNNLAPAASAARPPRSACTPPAAGPPDATRTPGGLTVTARSDHHEQPQVTATRPPGRARRGGRPGRGARRGHAVHGGGNAGSAHQIGIVCTSSTATAGSPTFT